MPDQQAVLGGIPIKIQVSPGLSDPVELKLVEHEYSKKNGARLEAMGAKARRTSFTAYFKGEEEWNNHLELIKLMEGQELLDFIHPKYGLMKGLVNLFVPAQTEIEHQISIAITFIEDIISPKRPVFAEDVEESVKNHMVAVNEQTIATAKTDIDTSLGEAGIGITDKVIDFNETIISEFSEVTGSVRHYLKEVDRVVNSMESTLAAITNPVNSFINALDFGTNLPGRMVKAATQLAERVSLLIDDLGTAPENFVNSYRDRMLIFEETLGIDEGTLGGTTAGSTVQKQLEKDAQTQMQKDIKIAGASAAAVKLAEIYSDDDDMRRDIQQLETEITFDDNGNYLGGSFAPQPIMTVTEIEAALFTAREYLQEAIDLDRTVQSLHDIALALIRNVNEVKINLEQVKTVTVTGSRPLFLIMLENNLPYKMIDRVVALNPDKPNPDRYSGEVKLYAA